MESYGLHSPATLRKAIYGKPGTYSPVIQRKNISGGKENAPAPGSPTATSKKIDIPQSPKLGRQEASYSHSPTRSFLNLFKKSKKKGGSVGDDSPSNSPDIQRRRRFFSSESNNSASDSEHDHENHDVMPQNSDSSHSSSEDEEKRQLKEGDITLFAVPSIISEPHPQKLTSILKKPCATFPCREDEEETEQNPGEGKEKVVSERKEGSERDKSADVEVQFAAQEGKQCDKEEKPQEEMGDSLTKEEQEDVDSNEDDEKSKEKDGPGKNVCKDEDSEEWDKVGASLPRRRCVSWDPSVKDPKPRKDSYTTYIEGWHKEFLRQERERKLRLKEMQKRTRYEKPQWQEPTNYYRMNSGFSPFGACNISCDLMMSRW